MSGWIKIHRKIMDDPMYLEEKFTRIQAWIDLLLLANYEDSEIYIRGNRVAVKRGQIAWSKDRLAQRWKWNKRTVLKFLDALQNRGQITLQNSKLIGLISIVNYDEYQNNAPQNAPQNAPPYKNIKNNKSTYNACACENSSSNDIEEISLNDCYNILSGNHSWRETITMNTRLSGFPDFTPEDFQKYLNLFFMKLANEGETEKTPRDAMSHFARWLKKELENGKHKQCGKSSTDRDSAKAQRDEEFKRFIQAKLSSS